MNTPTPDYGEPWKVDSARGVIDESGMVICYPFGSREEEQKMAGRIVACVNACAGMADPAAEIKAMRTAIYSAWELLQGIEDDIQGNRAMFVQAAIAKLKPFIYHDT